MGNFALFGCFAYAGAPLLDTEDIDSCPNDNAKKLGLVRDSADTFDVPVFQITGSTQVTFQCTVRVYELDQTLPVCPTSRRRRDADDDIVESETTVTATISIDGEERSILNEDGKDSGAATICFGASLLSLTYLTL